MTRNRTAEFLAEVFPQRTCRFTFDSQYQPAVKDASTDDVGFLRSSAKHPPPTTARAALTRTPAASSCLLLTHFSWIELVPKHTRLLLRAFLVTIREEEKEKI
ncbi:uncharacterized protein LOC123518466 isoform X1 [Portunus trituberculatus]|uniref:uncharacterized protein LOC123518466 isoform X1 n=1 Tax=Portunus trituberculatus TaxID=210409 RepID=UPI001E1D0615|nr:uncharacterized protein LOC123518466 isoform X1 [Portunus trituberculatus]